MKLTLTDEQYDVLKTLLEFHQDDEPDEYYPFVPFKELCELFGVPVVEEHDGQPDEMQEWHDFDPDC